MITLDHHVSILDKGRRFGGLWERWKLLKDGEVEVREWVRKLLSSVDGYLKIEPDVLRWVGGKKFQEAVNNVRFGRDQLLALVELVIF